MHECAQSIPPTQRNIYPYPHVPITPYPHIHIYIGLQPSIPPTPTRIKSLDRPAYLQTVPYPALPYLTVPNNALRSHSPSPPLPAAIPPSHHHRGRRAPSFMINHHHQHQHQHHHHHFSLGRYLKHTYVRTYKPSDKPSTGLSPSGAVCIPRNPSSTVCNYNDPCSLHSRW